MKRWSPLSRLLLSLALFALVLAPMAAPPSAQAMAGPEMALMPIDMPCCPDDQPAAPDCVKDCPFAALCISGLLSGTVTESLILLRLPIRDGYRTGWEAVLTSRGGEPPPRPPKA
jgi:hypothetical protein